MRKRSLLPLVGLIFIAVLLSLSVQLSRPSGVGPGGFMSLPSALMTFGIAYLLYAGSFFRVDILETGLQRYRSRWMAEVLILSGIYGAMMGFAILLNVSESNQTDLGRSPEALAIGSSAALIGLLYGIIGAISFYFIIQSLRTKTENESPHVETMIQAGPNHRSTMGFLGFILISGFAAWISSAMADVDIVETIFDFNVVYLFAALVVVSVYLHGAQSVRDVLTIPFWRRNDVTNILLQRLNVLRGCKRIISLLALVVISAVPISVLVSLGDEWRMMSALENSAIVFLWATFLLLFLYLCEGQLVQQVHGKTGRIHQDDRYFLLKFVVPPFLVWMIAQTLVLVVVLIVV